MLKRLDSWCDNLWIYFMCLCCVPLAEMPFRKWVLKKEGDAFAFENPKYYAKFVSEECY